MKVFGLIGQQLGHSFSKKYFSEKFQQEGYADYVYQNFELSDIHQFPNLLAQQELSGLNVTIPYKEQIIPFLDELEPMAKAIGAVNVIQFHNGRLIGHNTDVIGFVESIRPYLRKHHDSALVLGSGGASKAVLKALEMLGIESLIVSRSKGLTYAALDKTHYQEQFIIINTTPLGMYPGVQSCPDLDYSQLTASHLLFDLVYNPAESLFLQKGKAQGAVICNGLEMLQIQAEAGWRVWNS